MTKIYKKQKQQPFDHLNLGQKSASGSNGKYFGHILVLKMSVFKILTTSALFNKKFQKRFLCHKLEHLERLSLSAFVECKIGP
jgi:hypothetical protein